MRYRRFFLQYEPGYRIEFSAVLREWKDYAMRQIPRQPGELHRMVSGVDIQDTLAGRMGVEMSDAGHASFIAFARERGWSVREENETGTAITMFSRNT